MATFGAKLVRGILDLMKADFVHLHTHSHYSLLEALPKVSELVEAAKADGQHSLALTDNANMYGAIEFYKECKKAGIKPLLGVDLFVAPRTRHDKESGTDDHASRLVLLAKNLEGYHNLMRMVSVAQLEGVHEKKARVDLELIERYRAGLIAILPSHGSEIAHALRHGQNDRASQTADWYKKHFGADCFIEITVHPEIPGHEDEMRALIDFAQKEAMPLVAAQDIYYMHQEDGLACDLVNKIGKGGVLNRDGGEYQSRDFAFRSQAKMRELFADIPEALINTDRIARMCDVELTLGKGIFPVFPIPKGTTDNDVLRDLSEKGITLRGMDDTPELRARMDYELGVIATKGYASYFLIVADLLNHARSEGIFTNTRGSAAGSLVSYLCGITTVDPLAFNMPFERFLNPERPSSPDIDMDIADNRRDELIEYARFKYGRDHVIQIGTFGTMLARAAVRDVSRALGLSYSVGDAIAKLIPVGKQGFPVTIDSALKDTPELAEVYQRDPDAHEVLDLARKIEGNARHMGVHAAGVVIAPDPVTEYSPVQYDPKGGKTITQYDMYSIVDEYGGVGLLKFDMLGLTNLSVLADSVGRVKERLGIAVDLDKIPLDDTKTYEMLSRGETLGVFQMSGSGMTANLMELKPTVIHDLNAMVALYRPGPMAFIPDYIKRKRNPALVRYLDPRMETILKPTYGVLIYQDDVMMIAVQLAGYSWGEADKFRKAMGKKIPEEMKAQKDHFTKGCIAGGMKKDAVQKLWEQIETFAAYGFNKAHAASYGNLAYKTAYMKANYPVDYMAAVLTADAGDVEKIAEVVHECKRMGIKILPPSVNDSRARFTVVADPEDPKKQAIRFGLISIKNFGEGVAHSIIEARDEGGTFKDMADFLARIPDKNLNKKSLESLIQCGAFDDMGTTRGELLANIDSLLDFHREHLNAPQDQGSLFGGLSAHKAELSLKPAKPVPMDTLLEWEKELLGLYVSGHPLDKHKAKFADPKKTIRHAKENLKGIDTVIAGMIEESRASMTKSGERMAFLRLADYSDSIELVVFPRTYKEIHAQLTVGTVIAVKGRISDRNGQPSFVVDKAKTL